MAMLVELHASGGDSALEQHAEQRAPRLLTRDRPFRQSSGKFEGLIRKDRRFLWHELWRPRSWFHLLLSFPTTRFLLVLALLYTLVVLTFALVFLALAHECELVQPGQSFTFLAAFSLSVTSSATLSLGVASDAVARCWLLSIWVHIQVIVFTLVDATLVGLLFVRLSRGTSKASHIVFSDQAVISCVRQTFRISFQVSELSFSTHHPFLCCRPSVYVVRRLPVSNEDAPSLLPPEGYKAARFEARRSGSRSDGSPATAPLHTFLELQPMHVTNSATAQGDGSLLLTVPQQLTHEIKDDTSPLYPTESMGESTSPAEDLWGFREQLAHHILHNELEIIVAIDAIDPLSGSAFQARCSYTAEDLVFDYRFAPCLWQSPDSTLKIDWDAFHRLIPIAFDGEVAGDERPRTNSRNSSLRSSASRSRRLSVSPSARV